MTCAPREDSDQSGQFRPVWSDSSLRALWVAKGPNFLQADSKDWSDSADAQSDLSLYWAHWSFFMPRHQKVAGYYVIPSEILSVCPSIRPSVCLSVRPSVHPSVSAHHHSCIGNSSYSFRPILLKLYRCFKDGLKICILFFQNPEIIFYHFFPIFNLDIFRALILQICIWSMYLVSATPPTVFGESFWNFTGVLRMVWRYAYCFFRILKLFFITFFAFLT